MLSCHACHQNEISEVSAQHTENLVTSDCRPWKYGTGILVCGHCGLIQKKVDHEYLAQTQKIYESYSIYSQGAGAEQAVFSSTGAGTARSSKIIEWLNQVLEVDSEGDVLELGCGNGAFLRKFAQCRPQWKLTGTEFDDRNRSSIEAIPNANLHVGALADMKGSFDLIVAIHLLEHIVDPVTLLVDCARKLRAGGKVLIQVPNIRESPFDLLIADHCSHFSKESLTKTVMKSGYSIYAISEHVVSKEISLVIQPEKETRAPEIERSRELVAGHLAFFDRFRRLTVDSGSPLGVFGSSIAATWLASELDGRVQFFVDEDTQRIGKQHLGIPIVDISGIPKGAVVVLPMAPQLSQSIAARLRLAGVTVVTAG